MSGPIDPMQAWRDREDRLERRRRRFIGTAAVVVVAAMLVALAAISTW